MSTFVHAKCGKTIKNRGNRTGHCGNCCETYYGETAWNKHYTTDESMERIICRSPVPVEGKWWLDEYDHWHFGRRMTEDEKKEIWGV